MLIGAISSSSSARDLWGKVKKYRTLLKIALSKPYHSMEIKRVRNKVRRGDRINVVFLVLEKSMWKTDLLYQAMEKHPAYCPSILVIPRCNAKDIEANTQSTERYFLAKGYRVRMVTCHDSNQQGDALSDDDIIFFTHPHNDSLERFSISRLRNKLTCYVPYFEMLDVNYAIHFNGPTENMVWKFFQINELHKQIAQKHAYNRGRNIDVVGYPATEALYNDEPYENPWKSPHLKKIIFAPHHSISNSSFLSNSTFIEHAPYFKELAIRYSNLVNFAFKPHPLLKDKLYGHPDWGRRKTDEYWAFWSSKPNLQLEEGEYVGLFRESDALIHDCTSFITEYLYTGKPALYLNPDIRGRLNDYGKLGYDAISKVNTPADIEAFIQSIIENNGLKLNAELQKTLRPLLPPTTHIMNILDQIFLYQKGDV